MMASPSKASAGSHRVHRHSFETQAQPRVLSNCMQLTAEVVRATRASLASHRWGVAQGVTAAGL